MISKYLKVCILEMIENVRLQGVITRGFITKVGLKTTHYHSFYNTNKEIESQSVINVYFIADMDSVSSAKK